MCEIRFNINQKDGKLEKMINKIPSAIRTEVTKEALRYFLNAVRDNKIESNYIDSILLEEFKTEVKDNLFTLDDMFKILDSRATAHAVVTTTTTANATTPEQTVLTKNEKLEKNTEKDDDEEDEFDLDLTSSFDSEDSCDTVIDDVDFEDVVF